MAGNPPPWGWLLTLPLVLALLPMSRADLHALRTPHSHVRTRRWLQSPFSLRSVRVNSLRTAERKAPPSSRPRAPSAPRDVVGRACLLGLGVSALSAWLLRRLLTTPRPLWAAAATSEGRAWSLAGLRREVDRHAQRALKKVAKAQERVRAAEEEVEQLLLNPSTSLAALESAPDLPALHRAVEEHRARLAQLRELEAALEGAKGAVPPHALELAEALGVEDEPPARPPRPPPKPKEPKAAPRKPYNVFTSLDGVEIRVGRTAADNDELSLSPEHRDPQDFWMHASGCPGSHVVIRHTEPPLPVETLRDAAALAARHSKAAGARVKVTVTQCRHLRKPPGAKPGLLRLTGGVETVEVDMAAAAARLARLDATRQ